MNDIPIGERGVPISIYFPQEKKLVLIFSSKKSCADYIWNGKYGSYGALGINSYLKHKSKNKKNIFNEKIAFRIANIEQIDMLGTRDFLCLDERFKR